MYTQGKKEKKEREGMNMYGSRRKEWRLDLQN